MNHERVRRYVDRRDDPSVPQVLGRFELSPSAADKVRELLESPDNAEVSRGCSRKNLYRHVVTPSPEGGEGYPSPPSAGGGMTRNVMLDPTGGAE